MTEANQDGSNVRNVTVKTINNEAMLRYREWVEANRKYVHQATGRKVGYVHVPDMGANGFGEFHRYYLSEYDRGGLIVDVRFNGGGHVSQLILEKLARKRLGFDLTRWVGHEPYPAASPAGPIIAITNEQAGSDGDIFSHSFKMLKLGKLVGMRSWGGVIGIWPRNGLVDGSYTTQPEFSFWFKDVGWRVENYGAVPDKRGAARVRAAAPSRASAALRDQPVAQGVQPFRIRGPDQVGAGDLGYPAGQPDPGSHRDRGDGGCGTQQRCLARVARRQDPKHVAAMAAAIDRAAQTAEFKKYLADELAFADSYIPAAKAGPFLEEQLALINANMPKKP